MSLSTLIRPHIYKFKLGTVTVTTILEGYAQRHDMHPFLATNATPEAVEAVATEHRLPYPAMEHGFVATIIQTPDHLIAVDPGFGENSPMPTAGFFNHLLVNAGYRLEDIDKVAISHCHPDHIGNLMTNGAATFPNAEVMVGKREYEYWEQGENISEMRKPTQALFNKVVAPLKDSIRLLEPGDSLVPELSAVDAFGHSAGHFCFQLESEGQRLMLLNDTVPHYVASFALPEWHFSMDDDPDTAAITRQRILEMVVAEDIPVTGFHIPFPSIGYVEKKGNGFEFRPATYQFNLNP